MARNGKKSGGRDFRPGNNANPNGAPKVAIEVKEARKLNAHLVATLFNRYASMTDSEIRETLADPQVPVFDKAIIRVILLGGKTGDFRALNFIIDRTAGRVTEKLEVKMPKPTIVKMYGEDAVLVMGSQKQGEDDEQEDL